MKKIKLLFMLSSLIFTGVLATGSYYADSATVVGNTFTTEAEITPPDDPPPPDPNPVYGDVIVNEVMWMGSNGKPNDQWVELKNVSAKDIHIQNWYLTYKSNAGNELELLTIGDNRVIHPGEFYLATYYTKNNSAINVNPDSDDLAVFGYNNMQIKLYTDSTKSTLIDLAGDGVNPPSKGDSTNFNSMQRNAIAGDGSNYNNWNTCLVTTFSFWDAGRLEKGTPGAQNE